MKYVYRKHPSKMASLMVSFGAGSRVEFNSKYPAGIAHAMEHMRFKGSKNFTAKELLIKMETAGSSWNAFTEEDLVAYYITIPEENIETAFECLSDIIKYPTFPQEELTKELEVICQEVRMYDDDISDLVHRSLFDGAFIDSPLRSPIAGTEFSVKSITRQNLIDFNGEFYGTDKQLIILSSISDHRDLLEKYFGVRDDKLIWIPPYEVKYGAPFERRVKKEGQLQDIVSIAFGSKDLCSLVLNNPAALDVFNGIFGSGGASRLFLKIREDLGLVYGIRTGIYDNMDGTLFQIKTSTESGNISQVISEIDKQIDIIKNTLPTDAELNCAKNQIKSSEYSSQDVSIANVAKVLNEVFYDNDPIDKYLADVENVTAEDVKSIANIIFNGNKYVVIGCDKVK